MDCYSVPIGIELAPSTNSPVQLVKGGGVRIALHTKAHIHLASVVVVVYVHV